MNVFRDWMGCMASLVLVGVVLACTSPTHAQEVPYTGIVVENNVKVRAGAGNSLYVVGELDRGDIVQVDEVIFGWLKIEPPEGVYSYISKAFVDAEGDGKTGTVNANRTRVTAAGIEGPPGTSYREQTLLNEGASVRIVDEAGSFYKIQPPANTYVFLPPGSVRRASDMEAAAEPEEEGEAPSEDQAEADDGASDEAEEADDDADEATAQRSADAEDERETDEQTRASSDGDESAEHADDADEADDDTAEADADTDADETEAAEGRQADASSDGEQDREAEEPATDADADASAQEEEEAAERTEEAAEAEAVETPAVSDALREVEQRHLPSFDLPLEDQPIDRMIADYEEVLESNDDLPSQDERIIQHRLNVLERNQRLASALQRIADVRAEAEATSADLEARRAARRERQPDYDAVGELLASTVYDGQNLPRLFRLVDPATGRTLGYIEPSDKFEPSRMLGRVVGVVGEEEVDQGLRLRVFQVQHLDALETAEQEAAQDQ